MCDLYRRCTGGYMRPLSEVHSPCPFPYSLAFHVYDGTADPRTTSPPPHVYDEVASRSTVTLCDPSRECFGSVTLMALS